MRRAIYAYTYAIMLSRRHLKRRAEQKDKWRRLIDEEDVVARPLDRDSDSDEGALLDTFPEWRDDFELCQTDEEGDAADVLASVAHERRTMPRVDVGPHLEEFESAGTDSVLGNFGSITEERGGTAASKTVEDVTDFLVGLQCRRGVPEAVMEDLVNYLQANADLVSEALTKKTLPKFRAMRRQTAKKKAPKVKLDVVYEAEGEAKKLTGLMSFPKKQLATSVVDHRYTLYYVSLARVLDMHMELHPHVNDVVEFDLSVDGVPESKSSGRSVDILSVRFVGCRSIYCMAILQPMQRGLGIGDEVTLEHFLHELSKTSLRLRRVIADAPKRASLQGLKQHSATFACPYCVARKENGVFPSRSIWNPLRTSDDLRAISRRIAEDDFGSEDEREEICRGIKKVSPLASLLYLDLVRDVPAEPMHLIHLGVVRKMTNLSYSSGSGNAKQVDFKRASDSQLNEMLLRTKNLRRFARFTRRLDTGSYKAEEYRNVILAFWPAFVNTVPRKVTACWVLTVYIVRAVYLPEAAFLVLQENTDLERTLHFWYETFERSFGQRNCTYNVHVFAHLLLIRSVAPLHEVSAVDFEDHYNLLKRSYRPGTMSMGTQALQNTHLSRLHGHTCRRSKNLCLVNTERMEERFVFTRKKEVIKLTKIDGESLTGRVVPVACGLFLGAGLDLNDVWCYRRQPDIPEEQWQLIHVTEADVIGKCVECEGILSVLTFEMLDC